MRLTIRFKFASDLLDQYKYELYCWRFEAVRPDWQLKLLATRDVLTDRINRLHCKLFDHDYSTDGVGYPESGGEGFTCERCGHSFTAWH